MTAETKNGQTSEEFSTVSLGENEKKPSGLKEPTD
jgi:hypothetical protein